MKNSYVIVLSLSIMENMMMMITIWMSFRGESYFVNSPRKRKRKSYQYQSCNQYVKNLLSFFPLCFDTLHVQFSNPPLAFRWKHYDIITERIYWLPDGTFYDVCRSLKREGKIVRLFQVSQSHTRKKSDLFPSSNAFMCRFSCLSLYFLKSI